MTKPLDIANERMQQAYEQYRLARAGTDAAEAEMWRLLLLDAIDRNESEDYDLSKIVGFCWEVESVYDDQGGYDKVVEITYQWDGEEPMEFDNWEVIEERFEPRVAQLLTGSDHEWEGSTTIARLREVSF